MSATVKHELLNLVNTFTSEDGLNTSAIPALSFYRFTYTDMSMPSIYTPSLCIIVQGRKDVWLGKRVYTYGAMEFLIASVNLPIVGTVTEASVAKPYFVIQIDIDIKQLSELLLCMERPTVAKNKSEQGLFIGTVEEAMGESVVRLLKLLHKPEEIPVLADAMLREIYFRMLQSEYGDAIAQIALKGSSMQRISIAIQKLKNDFHQAISVDELADLSDMSTSSFHAHFKSVTNMSPLQFQKSIRLMEARNLMVSKDVDAATTAYRVGYESPSQFSREYARMFGNPPGRDIERLK
ncbi:HTH-type transcriptional activator RhaS [Thalassocella blandensis]|nr:HTH-type transcriptional activator RhaS [Thalassocella blandensis]